MYPFAKMAYIVGSCKSFTRQSSNNTTDNMQSNVQLSKDTSNRGCLRQSLKHASYTLGGDQVFVISESLIKGHTRMKSPQHYKFHLNMSHKHTTKKLAEMFLRVICQPSLFYG